jgi:hypothetical protein
MHNLQPATCVCGHETEFHYYASVNVDIDPKLKDKVLKRKINYFKCPKCGHKQELVARFLYHDMKKGLMIWVLPESERHAPESDLGDASGKLHAVMSGLGVSQKIVYGYDELFGILNFKKHTDATLTE